MSSQVKEKRPGFMDSFNIGVKNGWNICINAMLPGVIFAYAVTRILEMTNLMDVIGNVCKPIMIIYGLPGILAPALILSFISVIGGISMVAALFTSGQITTQHVAVMIPVMMLIGSMIGFMGRIFGTTGLKSKYYIYLIASSTVVSIAAAWAMHFFLAVL